MFKNSKLIWTEIIFKLHLTVGLYKKFSELESTSNIIHMSLAAKYFLLGTKSSVALINYTYFIISWINLTFTGNIRVLYFPIFYKFILNMSSRFR